MQLFYLTEVVVDIKASASTQQELDQFVGDGHLPLHHSYMESSEINKKTDTKIFTLIVEREVLQKNYFTTKTNQNLH